MYNIKQASIQSGVSVPLIRAWERRYGVVSPKRTAAGYRLYDEEAIATLSRVRELTAQGWSASEASRAVLAGEVAVDGAPIRAAQVGRTAGDAMSGRTTRVTLTAVFASASWMRPWPWIRPRRRLSSMRCSPGDRTSR